MYNIEKGSEKMLLIINPSKKLARGVSDTFYYMGILSYPATPSEALSEISQLYRAVLIISPDELADARDYVERLRRYKGDIPIFAICQKDKSLSYEDIFDRVFLNPIFSPTLAKKILEHANQNEYAGIGDYRLAGFNASWDHLGISCFSRKLRLTKTEAMILRYLIRSYPLPVNAEDILKHSFRPARAPESASIRTHISGMNKKFEKIFERKMIALIPHKGYIILTPEFMHNKNIL